MAMQTCVDPITEAPGSAVGLPTECDPDVLGILGERTRPVVEEVVNILPQTGLELWVYAVFAITLIVLGTALFRFARRY